MTDEQLIVALLKLDGWVCKPSPKAIHPAPLAWWYHPSLHQEAVEMGFGYPDSHKLLPDYLTSRDAIIPVINKQSDHIRYQIADFLCEDVWEDYDGGEEIPQVVIIDLICASPKQLCVALLKATGNYVS